MSLYALGSNPSLVRAFGNLSPLVEETTSQERGCLLTLAFHALSAGIVGLSFRVVVLASLACDRPQVHGCCSVDQGRPTETNFFWITKSFPFNTC